MKACSLGIGKGREGGKEQKGMGQSILRRKRVTVTFLLLCRKVVCKQARFHCRCWVFVGENAFSSHSLPKPIEP